MAMFDGIEMNVIHVAAQIFIVADAVFPKPSLPYTALTRTAFRFRVVFSR